jgi:hypothetical protein
LKKFLKGNAIKTKKPVDFVDNAFVYSPGGIKWEKVGD